jgi:hypothetical protein
MRVLQDNYNTKTYIRYYNQNVMNRFCSFSWHTTSYVIFLTIDMLSYCVQQAQKFRASVISNIRPRLKAKLTRVNSLSLYNYLTCLVSRNKKIILIITLTKVTDIRTHKKHKQIHKHKNMKAYTQHTKTRACTYK